jgi:hypothetical protein
MGRGEARPLARTHFDDAAIWPLSTYARPRGAGRPPAQTRYNGADNRPLPTRGKMESGRQATAEPVAFPRTSRRGAAAAGQESRIATSFRSRRGASRTGEESPAASIMASRLGCAGNWLPRQHNGGRYLGWRRLGFRLPESPPKATRVGRRGGCI